MGGGGQRGSFSPKTLSSPPKSSYAIIYAPYREGPGGVTGLHHTHNAPCEGTRLVLYTKNHARSKMRPLYVKIMVYSPFSLAVGRLKKKKKKKKEKMEKITVWPISVYNSSDVF